MTNLKPKKYLSIKTKIIFNTVLFVLVILGIIFAVSFIYTKKIAREDLRMRLANIASVASLQVDANKHSTLHTRDDEKTEAYQDIKTTLQKIRNNSNDIYYIYTLRENENKDITFVVDAEENPDKVSHIGDVYDDANQFLKDNFLTINKPVVESNFTSDRWGTWISGYAPFYDKDGKREGVLGIDVKASNVTKRENSILLVYLVIFFLIGLLSVILGIFFNKMLEKSARDLEKFKLAVDNATDQVVITDSDGVVLYGNKAVEKITGFKPEEALGQKAGTLWRSPMPLSYYKNLWHTIKEEKKVFVGEIQNKRKNGETYIANLSISPVLDSQNRIIYFVSIEHDITKEKEIDKAKSEFVSLASHQLKTPIGAVSWNLEALLSGDFGILSDEQNKVINQIYKLNNRMSDIIANFLNVSRIELGTFLVEPVKTDFVSICEDVLFELKDKIVSKKYQIEKNYQSPKIEAMADPKVLRMIFQNLLSNAVKYTGDNGNISISIKIEEQKIKIIIADNGEAIPEKDKSKIFEKMFRASNARSMDPDGNGLGLYVLKYIIGIAGGKIWFESEAGKGTTFFVEFEMPGMKEKIALN